MLRAWVFPSGIYWLMTLFMELPLAAMLSMFIAMGCFVWAVPRELMPRERGHFPGRLMFLYALPAFVFGCASLCAPIGRFQVDTSLPPDRVAFDSARPLEVGGLGLGPTRVEGAPEGLRPLFGFWGITARRRPDGLLVYQDTQGHVVRIDGKDLQQGGKVLAQAGYPKARVDQQFAGDLRKYRESVCQFGYASRDERVTSCSVASPKSVLLDPGVQVLSISGISLEMSRSQVESALGKPGRAAGSLTPYGQDPIWVAYQNGFVAAVAGPVMQDGTGDRYPSNGYWIRPEAHGIDCSHQREPFTGALLIAPSWKSAWRPFDRKLLKELLQAARASKY